MDIITIDPTTTVWNQAALDEIQLKIDKLPIQDLFVKDEYTLASNILSRLEISPGGPVLIREADKADIENACSNILALMGDSSKINSVKDFLVEFAGFYELPYNKLHEIEPKVKIHLAEVVGLINRYKSDPKVNLESLYGFRKEKEFYKRCVEAKDEIVDYLVLGIYKRAIYKARLSSLDRILTFGRSWHDYPYSWARTHKNSFFDYEAIDVSSHRIDFEFNNEERKKLKILYDQGRKREFYDEQIRLNPPANIFDKIDNYYCRLLPDIIKDRIPIFLELEKLYKGERWIAFSALAIIQIEGLFTDMTNVLKSPGALDSLPKKVDAIQGNYFYSKQYFDYYQYVFPEIRNDFAHNGKLTGEDFWVLAHDLLYDIWHLLWVFSTIKEPIIVLNRIFKSGDIRFLRDIEDFNVFLKDIKWLYEEQKNNSQKENEDNLKNWNLWLDFHDTGTWGKNWEELWNDWLESMEFTLRIVANALGHTFNGVLTDPFSYFLTRRSLNVAEYNAIVEYVGNSGNVLLSKINAIRDSLRYLNSYPELFPKRPNNIDVEMQKAREQFKEAKSKLEKISNLLNKK